MECYIHPGTAAVGACVACGNFVCDVCRVSIKGKITCKACLERGETADWDDPPPFSRSRPLRRSRRDKVLGGVAAGVAMQFDADTTLVRVIWAVLALSGVGVLLYLVLWAVIPLEDDY